MWLQSCLLLISSRLSVTLADAVSGSQVHRIAYHEVGGNGSFEEVVGMSSRCETRPKSFNGPLAPFDEDVSFRP